MLSFLVRFFINLTKRKSLNTRRKKLQAVKNEMHKTSGMLFEISLPSVKSKMLACNKRLSWSFSIWQVEISQKGMVAFLWSWIKCQMTVLYRLCLASGTFNKCKRTYLWLRRWEAKSRCFSWWCLRCGLKRDGECLAVEFQKVFLLKDLNGHGVTRTRRLRAKHCF